MLDPQQIRFQVQHGEIPAHWRLIRGSASLAVRDFWKTQVFPMFFGIIFCSVAVIGWGKFFNLPWNPDFTPLYVEIAAYLLGFIIGFFIRANMAKNAALILLPEKCLFLANMNDNAYTCKILWYASVADMQLHVSFWAGPYLAVRYYDGKKQKWYPGPNFGRRARTVQDILTDYTLYQAARSAYIHYSS